MFSRELPCLPLILERHCNAVRSTGEEYKYPEIEMYMFPQTWGSTSEWDITGSVRSVTQTRVFM